MIYCNISYSRYSNKRCLSTRYYYTHYYIDGFSPEMNRIDGPATRELSIWPNDFVIHGTRFEKDSFHLFKDANRRAKVLVKNDII